MVFPELAFPHNVSIYAPIYIIKTVYASDEYVRQATQRKTKHNKKTKRIVCVLFDETSLKRQETQRIAEYFVNYTLYWSHHQFMLYKEHSD